MINPVNFLSFLLLARAHVVSKNEQDKLIKHPVLTHYKQQRIEIADDLVNSNNLFVAFGIRKLYYSNNHWFAVFVGNNLNKKPFVLKIRKRRFKKEKFKKKANNPYMNLWFALDKYHPVHKFLHNSYSFREHSLQQSWLLSKYVAEITKSYIGVYPTWLFLNLKKISANERFFLVCRAVNKKRVLGPFYHDNKALFKLWFTRLTYLKDPNGLTSLINLVLIKTHLKKHRILFFILNRILKIWFFYFNEKQGILGYSFFFKGKLGKKGSVKKTKFFRKYGITSFTNKSVRVNHKEYSITTMTGAIGASLSIFF